MKTKEFLDTDMISLEDESKFRDPLTNFIQHAEQEITCILEEEKKFREGRRLASLFSR